MQSSVYLFLDFDGVLHGVKDPPGKRLARVPLLEEWLRMRPQVCVVISSTWRFDGPLPEVVRPFSADLTPRFVGATPGFKQRDWRWTDAQMTALGWPTGHKRHCEVLAWLLENGRTASVWAALDDSAEYFAPGTTRLVLCDPNVGLTARELNALDRLFGL